MQKSSEENEGKPQNRPKAEEDHPSEDVPQEEEGNPPSFEEGVSQAAPVQGCREDGPVRRLDPEEMLRGVDELERLREETGRVRNKFVTMH
ncbi:transcription elongation factor A protein-like 8 [Pteronotus mesoamericanus]|uniref:transcription elongation factor A protein-like 8 n=1 Tax=Pteronotus mesoamericanus TaxID=1884717 RepID=UPI0023EAEEC4|nr:transcription elongation factor A protein-like 8 [Pteronotus parnellii mesoamericanus]